MNISRIIKSRCHRLKYAILDTVFPDPLLQLNVKFKNIHQGERCFILGSGPSIVRHDLKKLKGEVVITQNHFHAHADIAIIKPRYHCVVQFYQGEAFKDDWIKWFSSMEERLPSDTHYFLHSDTKKLVEDNGFFKDRISYLQAKLDPLVMPYAPVDITKTIMSVPTVLTQCLAVAIYMGFKEIYLVGFDMDQVCNISNREKLRFYGDSPITNNRYELDNAQKHETTGLIWYHFWMMWRQFVLLREAAEQNGSQIINLTHGGLLNCYRRESFDAILV